MVNNIPITDKNQDQLLTPRQKDGMDAAEDPSSFNPVLTLRQALRLFQQIDEVYHPAVLDIPELKAIPPEDRVDRMLCYVEEDPTPDNNGLFRFFSSLTSTEDIPSIVAPNVGTGRWVQISKGVSDHNSLGGMQGGFPDERFHLEQSRYQATAGTKGTPGISNLFRTEIDDRAKGLIPIIRQADTSSSVPNNTGVRGFLFPTTLGNGVVEGNLLYDDGTGIGVMEILPRVDGQVISVGIDLLGGTFELDKNSLYHWDDTNLQWLKMADDRSLGSLQIIRVPIGTNASYVSDTIIPGNSKAYNSIVRIDSTYPGGTKIEVGYAENISALQAQTDNNPQALGQSSVPFERDWHTLDRPVLVSISGSPGVGSGAVIVFAAQPKS